MPSRAPLYTQTPCITHRVLFLRIQTLGGVWECLEVFGARYVVWGPSEGRTESEGVKSQLGPQVPQNTPQTLMYASYGVYTCCVRLWDACGARRGLYMVQKYPYVTLVWNLGYTQIRAIWYKNGPLFDTGVQFHF